MTNKEYKKKKSMIEYYNGNDYLMPEELKKLHEDIKQREGVLLPDCNKKATIRKENGCYILTSYYTDVCFTDGKKLNKLWDGYSVTTLNHINKFCELFGLPKLNKREWIEL